MAYFTTVHCGIARDKGGLSILYQLQLTKFWLQQNSRAVKSYLLFLWTDLHLDFMCIFVLGEPITSKDCLQSYRCPPEIIPQCTGHTALRPSQHWAGRYPSSATQFILCLYWKPRQNYQFTCNETRYSFFYIYQTCFAR